MERRSRSHQVLFLAVAACTLVGVLTASARAAAETRVMLRSLWRDTDIVVDGSNAEWVELAPFGKDVPFSIGLKNDGEYVYLVLDSSDQSAMSMLARRGLIVWFDAEGGTRKRFGIRYPVVEGGAMPGGRPGGFGGRGGEGRPQDPGGAQFDPAKDGRFAHLEVIGPGNDDRRNLMLDKAPGIEVRIGRVEGTLVYELKVPLRVSSERPYAIGAAPGATIGVGLETPEVEGGAPRLPFGGFGMGLPGGGAPGGAGGGRGGGGDFKPPKPIKAWVTARLATQS